MASSVGDLDTLCSMFPGTEASVAGLVLESVAGDMERATTVLLDMSLSSQCSTEQSESHSWAGEAEQSLDCSETAESSDSGSGETADTGETERERQRGPVTQPVSQASIPASCQASAPDHSINSTRMPMPGPSVGKAKKPGRPGSQDPPGLPVCLTQLEQGLRVLVVLRGLPGSGKSSLAARLLRLAGIGQTFSTDDFFVQLGRFQPERLSEAHGWNQGRAQTALRAGEQLVVIDNTHTMAWEMRPYITMGVENGYQIHLLEPNTPWRFNPKQLAAKNSHGVPRPKIQLMLDRYERDLKVESLAAQWNLTLPAVDIFESDEEPCDENSAQDTISSFSNDAQLKTDTTNTSMLNPQVVEFVPVSVDVEGAGAEGRETQETEETEVSRLLEMFPDLQWDEAATLYREHEGDTDRAIASLLDPQQPRQPSQSESGLIRMTLDPLFAVELQEVFGSPAEAKRLGKLGTSQLLSLEIGFSLAQQIFQVWQQNIEAQLGEAETALAEADQQFPALPGPAAPPRTVLAPNAVEYYDDQLLEQAKKESLKTPLAAAGGGARRKPLIIVRQPSPKSSPQRTAARPPPPAEFEELDLYMEQRNQLYRKALESRGNKVPGVAAYYAGQARKINSHIKQTQKQKQMEMFLTANRECPETKIDLHYLQTGEAIKQLDQFLKKWQAKLAR